MALVLDGNGTMTVGNGDITGLAAGALPSNVIGAGAVLQVVSAVTSTEVTTALATYVDTGLSASITPTSSSSKILVILSHGSNEKTNGSGNNRLYLKLLRGSTDLAIFGNGLLYTATALVNRGSASFNYLDSPATTSSVTYKTQFTNGDAGASVQVQTNNSPSSITLMEIAA